MTRHEQMENGVFEWQNASIWCVVCAMRVKYARNRHGKRRGAKAEKALNDKKWIKFVDCKPKSDQKQPTSLWRINCATKFISKKIYPFHSQFKCISHIYRASGCGVYQNSHTAKSFPSIERLTTPVLLAY